MSRRAVAASTAAAVAGAAIVAVGLTLAAGWSFSEALDAFVVSNVVLGLSFGLCGSFVAWHRPTNPIGWLLAVAGVLHTLTALTAPLDRVLIDADAPTWVVRVVATVAVGAWPWSIGLLVPLFLLVFPDGRLVSPAWRWVVGAVVVTSPLFVGAELAPEPMADGLSTGYLTIANHDDLGALWSAGELRTLAALLLGLVALGLRYRRGDEQQRQQILWLLLAAAIVLAFITPWSLVAGTPVVVLLSIPLIPVAVAIAVVRHQLLDIRLVVARVAVWAGLSAVVVVTYVVLVWLLDAFVSERLGRSAVATVLIALAAAGILPRLQRTVDRHVYGDRRDPARVISKVGEHLSSDADAGLPAVVASVGEALRLPYVALRTEGGFLAVAGAPSGTTDVVALSYHGNLLGELVVGLRPGEKMLAAADRNVLRLVAASSGGRRARDSPLGRGTGVPRPAGHGSRERAESAAARPARRPGSPPDRCRDEGGRGAEPPRPRPGPRRADAGRAGERHQVRHRRGPPRGRRAPPGGPRGPRAGGGASGTRRGLWPRSPRSASSWTARHCFPRCRGSSRWRPTASPPRRSTM